VIIQIRTASHKHNAFFGIYGVADLAENGVRMQNPSTPVENLTHEILLVDWNVERVAILTRALEDLGNPVEHIDNLRATVHYNSPVVLISAFWPCHFQPEGQENAIISFLRRVRNLSCSPDIIVFGCADCGLSVVNCCRWLLEGARFLVDAADPIVLRSHVRHCFKLRAEIQEYSTGRETFVGAEFGVVYASDEMRQVMGRIKKAASLKFATILMTGPTGSGKQKLAEALQRLDPWRPNAPVLTVNCATITGSLAESELFGHRRGSYTGATADRMGCFRAANGGTLVLDEIGELELSLQPKLLRVLETSLVKSLGQDSEVSVEVRVIATTNRDLRAMAAEGKFRMDLYQRLAMIEICIPPLAQRVTDLLPLMRLFLEKHRMEYNHEAMSINPAVIEVLSSYRFEGNVRELENIVRAVLFNKKQGDTVQIEDLPRHVLEQITSKGNRPDYEAVVGYLSGRVVQDKLPLAQLLDECESVALKAALNFTDGNRSAAAALLQISERTLYNKLQRWPESRPRNYNPDAELAAS
jgi:DNA-binding NtrC family response regulator